MSNVRWGICGMLFLATTINYLDRQALSLTWKDFIAPEFHWTDTDYGNITATFSIVYAIANIFAGRIIDRLGTLKGYLWAIGIWSVGALLHAGCGWATARCLSSAGAAQLVGATGEMAALVASVSVWFFIAARVVLAVGEAGNFPAAVKVTAAYFPKKDRAFATSIFNAGATVGALFAPLSIPTLARYFRSAGVGNGWEMAFIIIGGLGFLWMGLWLFIYKDVDRNPRVNALERAYIEQDKLAEMTAQDALMGVEGSKTAERGSLINVEGSKMAAQGSHTNGEVLKTAAQPSPTNGEAPKMSFRKVLGYRQTWEFVVGKFMTDGVWWFLLFWTPAYISDVYGFTSDTLTAQLLIFALYGISMLSIYGGKLPTIIINRTQENPYAARMKAMLVFALFPLLALFAQPLGAYSYWYPVIIIGIVCAAHQSWSANIYTVVSDMFPPGAIGTVVGLGQMAGGVSSFLINKLSGQLFDYAEATGMHFLGFAGKPAGYFIIFLYCSVAYLVGWSIMKLLVPRYKRIEG